MVRDRKRKMEEGGVSRPLDSREFIDFLEALETMPWSARGAKVLEEK